eukprot:5072029-Amphidinium_carterae.1
MEPTATVIASWASLSDVPTWADFTGDFTDPNTEGGCFVAALGADPTKHWRPIAMISEEHMDDIIKNIQGKESDTNWRSTPALR